MLLIQSVEAFDGLLKVACFLQRCVVVRARHIVLPHLFIGKTTIIPGLGVPGRQGDNLREIIGCSGKII